MARKQPVTSCIIGDDKLVIQCGEILLSRKHRILTVISSAPAVQKWASKQHIQCISSLPALKPAEITQCDYLFSIINYAILPEWILTLPKYFSINNHDALLPRYAGVHATSWALLNQEKYHGVTWHVMEKKVDAGDILKQKTVAIEKDETALSLNLKCYQAAMETFSELVDELSINAAMRKPQDLTQRTYYGLNQKPPSNGWINWHDTAENIERLFRALKLGDYPNHLGSLKFTLSDQAYMVDALNIAKNKSKQPAGNITNLSNKQIRIATQTQDIIITQIKTLAGHSYEIKKFAKHHRLKSGTHLSSPNEKMQAYFQQISAEISMYENFWLKKLAELSPVTLPFLTPIDGKNYGNSTCLHTYNVPIELQAKLKKYFPKYSLENILFTTCLIYLFRVNNQETMSIDLNYPSLTQPIKKLNTLIAAYVPFTVQLKDELIFEQALQITQKQYGILKKNKTYLKDIYARYPKLSQICPLLPIGIILDNTFKPQQKKLSHPVTLTISKDKMHLYIENKARDKNLNIFLANIPGHLHTMLEGLTRNPKEHISFLPLLTAEEKKKILIDWNKTEADYPRDKTIPQLFEEQVKKIPNKVAIVFEAQELTYSQLNEKANQLAHYLHKQGVKVRNLVAICLERSLEMVIGMLGILKAGAAYVPIDPEYPEARMCYILQDTKVKHILSQTDVIKKFKKLFTTKKTILLDQSEWISHEHNDLKDCVITSSFLGYVMYTSGSTGKPKGVMVTHQNIVNLAKNKGYLRVNKSDRIAQVSNFAFDAATFEIWGALLNGAKLVIISKNFLLSPDIFLNNIKYNKVSILFLTSALFNQIYNQNPQILYSVKKLLTGGEKININILKKFVEIKKKSPLILHVYGITECTTFSLRYKIDEKILKLSFIPIGKPISNTQCYVLDNYLQPVPTGFNGELFISSEGVSKGYLRLLKQTKEKFITNFLVKDSKSHFYRTGDIVRWLPDGNLDYIGRNDDQIKIRGFRIELGEVASVLMKHPYIMQAVVCTHEKNNRKQLIAYFIRKSKTDRKNDFNLTTLRDYIEQRLPKYMVPASFFEVDDFPITSNGKIDKKKLIEQQNYTLKHQRFVKKPTSKTQAILAKIWQKTLNINCVGINDNFFALGGDSIVAMQVVTKANAMGLHFATKDIFRYPTITSLAKEVKVKIFDTTRIKAKQVFFYLLSSSGFSNKIFSTKSNSAKLAFYLFSYPLITNYWNIVFRY